MTARPDVVRAMAMLSPHPEDGEHVESPATRRARPRPAGHRGATSALSIDETLLLHSAGWEPVDVVFGLSWWSIPWGVWQWQTGEVEEASSAFGGAVAQASQVLRDECAKAGGIGVLGVEVEVQVASHHASVTLTGTAVRRVGSSRGGFEFLSDLSARDFVLLERAGWWPLGIVAGASFVIAPRRSAREWAAQQNQNLELPNLTQALYLARERAMERLQESGAGMAADGVVAVRLREGPIGYGNRVMQFVAIGTAVHLREDEHRRIEPEMVVTLDEIERQFEAQSLRRTPGR
ncbi:MAG: heavy metal-binding domain-containing protein [Acidimicrobiales bacterium]